jgi:hypothetical protein
VDLSPAGIKLSRAGYTMPTVKILIPELAAETVMNHRNPGESAPCLATTDTLKVEDVVQGNPVTEKADFTITLEKTAEVYKNSDGQDVCSVYLTETVSGTVRGFAFNHVRESALPERVVADCK